LGLQSIGFDVIFMLQHYVLYRDRKDIYLNTLEDERRRLIVEGRVPITVEEEDEESGSYHYL
jgi:cystinosin